MTILIDSHIYIWLLFESYRFSPATKRTLQTAEELYVSIASLTELTFKHGSGKLKYNPANLCQGLAEANIHLLAITNRHLEKYAEISLSHKDPFDRLLIAQAQCENLPLLTADQTLLDSSYPTIDARK
ncbi:type II toxin-antitoxin system VapC family toxin [Candidatus Saccharibacteria bacterium]|nr:MAG: type II toxin-antitoxin system VapC family toxin [Candidatus Saccharibacteria bacterium]